MWSILSILATLSLASASPVFRRDDGESENLDDNDNEISCVKYKFSAPFNNVTYQGQAEFVANLTTYTFNEDTNGGEFTNPQIVRLGVGEDEGVVRCDGEDCDAGDYFAFEVCESRNGTGQYGINDPQSIYGHVIYQDSVNNGTKRCVSAVSGDNDDDDDEDEQNTDLSGSGLALTDCLYDLESSVAQAQYWRMLLIYDYPVVSLVTASNATYSPDPSLVNAGVPVTVYSQENLTLGTPYTWFSFQTPLM